MVAEAPARLEDAIEAARMVRAERDFERFLPYMKVLDPPPGGGIVPFQPWPHLVELARAFRQYRLIVLVKSKQVGASWLVGGYAVHTAAYHEGAQVALFSKGQLEAGDLLGKSQFIHEHLPKPLQRPLAPLKSEMVFPSMHSRILPLPSTEDAGVGLTSTLVVMDEADYHDYFAENYDIAAKPAADAGGQVIVVSTVNPMRLNSAFQRLVKKAGDGVPGENGFVRFFLPYTVRPGRDEAWYQAGLAAADDPWVFTKNYPRTLAEALAPSKRLAFFDQDALVAMLQEEAREPRRIERGLISIWGEPTIGGHYILSADTAWGRTGSYSCASVANWTAQSMEQVAELHGRPAPDEMALESVNLHKLYNHAYMALERAGEGQERDGESVVVVDKVMELLKDCECRGDGRVFFADHDSEKPSRPGWQTDGNSRPYMLSELAIAVRNRQVVIRSKAGIGEMMQFIRTETGRAEAAEGAYDDRPITYAIGWQMRKHATFRAGPGRKASRLEVME